MRTSILVVTFFVILVFVIAIYNYVVYSTSQKIREIGGKLNLEKNLLGYINVSVTQHHQVTLIVIAVIVFLLSMAIIIAIINILKDLGYI